MRTGSVLTPATFKPSSVMLPAWVPLKAPDLVTVRPPDTSNAVWSSSTRPWSDFRAMLPPATAEPAATPSSRWFTRSPDTSSFTPESTAKVPDARLCTSPARTVMEPPVAVMFAPRVRPPSPAAFSVNDPNFGKDSSAPASCTSCPSVVMLTLPKPLALSVLAAIRPCVASWRLPGLAWVIVKS